MYYECGDLNKVELLFSREDYVMTLDEWAITLTVFIAVMLPLLFAGPRLYRSKYGSEAVFRKGNAYFDCIALVSSFPPGGAVLLSYAFLPIPSWWAYAIGGILVVLGCVAGGFIFHGFIELLVLMNTAAPEAALESRKRLRMSQRGERPPPAKRRRDGV